MGFSYPAYLQRFGKDARLVELLVEGLTDQLLINWWKRNVYAAPVGFSVESINVLSVASVEPRTKEVENTRSNRTRLIDTVSAVCTDCPSAIGRILGVVDQDFLSFAPGIVQAPNILLTDYRDCEMYVFDADVLGRFFYFSGATKVDEGIGEQIIVSISQLLLELSVLQATLHLDGFALASGFDPRAHARLNPQSLTYELKRAEMLRTIFASQNRAVRERFEPLFDTRMKAVLGQGPDRTTLRRYIRGHDYMAMLKYIAQTRFDMPHLQHWKDERFAMQVFGVLDTEKWKGFSLFEQLATWIDGLAISSAKKTP